MGTRRLISDHGLYQPGYSTQVVMILHDLLPQLMPKAIAWAKEQEDYILLNGRGLSDEEHKIAVKVGVIHPDKIRVCTVDQVPSPDDSMLAYLCEYTGLLGPDTVGLTLHYGIFVRSGYQESLSLLAHECRHVAQYEEHESIAAFLGVYLTEILEYGYEASPLEVDARMKAWEVLQ